MRVAATIAITVALHDSKPDFRDATPCGTAAERSPFPIISSPISFLFRLRNRTPFGLFELISFPQNIAGMPGNSGGAVSTTSLANGTPASIRATRYLGSRA